MSVACALGLKAQFNGGRHKKDKESYRKEKKPKNMISRFSKHNPRFVLLTLDTRKEDKIDHIVSTKACQYLGKCMGSKLDTVKGLSHVQVFATKMKLPYWSILGS